MTNKEKALLRDLRKRFQDRLVRAISDHIDLTETVGLNHKWVTARLIQDLVHITGCIAIHTCRVTREEFGRLCTEQLSTTEFKFRPEADDAK